MSRSKHTDPRAIRAARRLRAPDKRRGTGDLSRRRRLGRELKALGGVVTEDQQSETAGSRARRQRANRRFTPVATRAGLLKIVVRPARRGYQHPLRKSDIQGVFDALGPVAAYGLRSVELVHSSLTKPRGVHAFGRYQVPGRIILYEQPLSPWRVMGLFPKTIRQFEAAGAIITKLPGGGTTLVDWPGDRLRRFMLEEVLLHEIGHHVLQQHKGKRPVRIARSRDHEAFASQFMRHQQVALRERS